MILNLVLGKYDLGARQQILFEFFQAQFWRNLFFFFSMIPARPKRMGPAKYRHRASAQLD